MRIHLALLVSISPNRSLLPPLLVEPIDVADAADEVTENEAEGLLARADGVVTSSLRLIMHKKVH